MTTLLMMVCDLIKAGYLTRHAIDSVSSSSLAIRYNISRAELELAYKSAFMLE
jgi:hypothetical protein